MPDIIGTLKREGWTINQESDGYHLTEPRGEESFFCPTKDEVRRYFGGRRYRLSRGWLPKRPEFYECGICGSYHPAAWDGDCREDEARFNWEELNDLHGISGWTEVDMPGTEPYLPLADKVLSVLCPVHGDVRDTSMKELGGFCTCSR